LKMISCLLFQMISTKVLLRTGFYKVWRPVDGIFTSINDMLCEDQYNQVNYVSTIVHLEGFSFLYQYFFLNHIDHD
jgi:hypothetical protein